MATGDYTVLHNYVCINVLVMFSHPLPMATSVTMVKTYIIYSLSLPALTGYITLLLETIDEVRVS